MKGSTLDFGNFFRVVDVAFMVPGFVVIVLNHEKLMSLLALKHYESDRLLLMTALFLGSYTCGLFVHGVTRILLFVAKKAFLNRINMAGLNQIPQDNKMALYLWNTSSVCFNLGTAFLVGGLVKMVLCGTKNEGLLFLIGVSVMVYWYLGVHFRAYTNKMINPR